MIEIKNLQFRFDGSGFGFRLADLSFSSGSRIALVGPSGCGKTTLLNLIAGVLVPDRGGVHIQGTEVSGLSDAMRRRFRIGSVGMVFQEFELLEYLNVEQNILLPYSLGLKRPSDNQPAIEHVTDSLEISSLLRRRIDRLSQGERQRVAIARALMSRPSVILADEPTGNVDPAQSRKILDLLFDHVARYKSTLVMATHDHGLLEEFDRVIDFSRPNESGVELLAEAEP